MPHLTDRQLQQYLASATEQQSANIEFLRRRILAANGPLVEKVNEGSWLKGLLFYSTATEVMVYALGPRAAGRTTLHMMPYYASKELQRKYSPTLKPFLSGKSCISFRNYEDLPLEALEEIFEQGIQYRERMP